MLSALISLVLIRIVVVTALSYGLSQFAVQMVVRVLVLELIPTTARAVRRAALHDPARRRARGVALARNRARSTRKPPRARPARDGAAK